MYFIDDTDILIHINFLYMCPNVTNIFSIFQPPNSPLNAGFNAHEQELAQQKKIDTLKKQSSDVGDLQKKEPVIKTKNVSGPPVYYPPGHEMFAKKEESEAAWRAQVRNDVYITLSIYKKKVLPVFW